MYSREKSNSYLHTAVSENVRKIASLFMILAVSLLTVRAAEAQLQIEIIDGNASALPIAFGPEARRGAASPRPSAPRPQSSFP